jgi:hypothetical protein
MTLSYNNTNINGWASFRLPKVPYKFRQVLLVSTASLLACLDGVEAKSDGLSSRGLGRITGNISLDVSGNVGTIYTEEGKISEKRWEELWKSPVNISFASNSTRVFIEMESNYYCPRENRIGNCRSLAVQVVSDLLRSSCGINNSIFRQLGREPYTEYSLHGQNIKVEGGERTSSISKIGADIFHNHGPRRYLWDMSDADISIKAMETGRHNESFTKCYLDALQASLKTGTAANCPCKIEESFFSGLEEAHPGYFALFIVELICLFYMIQHYFKVAAAHARAPQQGIQEGNNVEVEAVEEVVRHEEGDNNVPEGGLARLGFIGRNQPGAGQEEGNLRRRLG